MARSEQLRHRRPDRMQGISLIEVLVALLLAAILGLGTAYVAGRATNSKLQYNAQTLALNRMRTVASTATSANCGTSNTANNEALTAATGNVVVLCNSALAGYTVSALNASGTAVFSAASVNVGVPVLTTNTSDTNTSTYLPQALTIQP